MASVTATALRFWNTACKDGTSAAWTLDRLLLVSSHKILPLASAGRSFRVRDRVSGRARKLGRWITRKLADRKRTRLNSSHSQISYAVFCLKKKKKLRVKLI